MLWILVYRLIRGFVRPSTTGRRKRSRPWMLFTLAGFVALISVGALASGDHPTCAGQAMRPGQSCGQPDGTSVSYEDLQRTSRNVRVLVGVVSFAAAVGLTLFGIHRQTAIRDARILVAQHRAMQEAQLPPRPVSYDWNDPQSVFTPPPPPPPPPPGQAPFDPNAPAPNPYTNPNLYWR